MYDINVMSSPLNVWMDYFAKFDAHIKAGRNFYKISAKNVTNFDQVN